MSTSNQAAQALMAQQKAVQANLNARMLMLSQGDRYFVQQPPVSGALGTQLQLPIPRVGIMMGVMLDVTVTPNITAAATASPLGPYTLINKVTLADWYGNTRHNTAAYTLNALNAIRAFRPYNRIASSLNNDTNTFLYEFPTAVGSTAPIRFTLWVPIAYDRYDSKGALIMQTATGNATLTLTLANALVGNDPTLFPYTAGTASAGNVTVTPYYDYIMPPSLAPADLPQLDLATVYAVQDQPQDSTNIVVGTNKFINYPPQRNVYSAFLTYNNGNTLNFGSDVTLFETLINGVTPLKQWSPRAKLIEQRNMIGADFPPGLYYFDSRHRPIDTNLYGNFQLIMNPSAVSAGAYINTSFEMTYPLGAPLPGLAV